MKIDLRSVSRCRVTEYENFISFSLENYEREIIFVQYRREDVWIDKNGVWQIKEGQQPFYIWRLAAELQFEAAAQRPEVKLSPAILSSFARN